MYFSIGVENFAKIESAKICVDNYTVLVGENNSGKTFLMQLVQGVGEKEHIIKEILGKDIAADRLYIDISMDERTTYDLVILDSKGFDKKFVRDC